MLYVLGIFQKKYKLWQVWVASKSSKVESASLEMSNISEM